MGSRRFDTVVVHHSATPRSVTMVQIRKVHKEQRGFRDIGYHYVIEGSGALQIGRELPQVGAHCPPNAGRIGICVVGDNTRAGCGWVGPQWTTLTHLIDALLFCFPWLDVQPHCNLRPTLCPGFSESGTLSFADRLALHRAIVRSTSRR